MSVIHYLEFLPLFDRLTASDEAGDYVCRLSLRGNLGMEGAHETGMLLSTLIGGGLRHLIFNMENLSYIDSVGIGMVIKIKKLISDAGGDLALYNVPPKVNEVFGLVNLKGYIRAFYAESQALDYLRQSEAAKRHGGF